MEEIFKQFVDSNKKFKTRDEAKAYLQQVEEDIIEKADEYFRWCSRNIDKAADIFDLEVDEIKTEQEYEEIKNLYAELFDIAQHYDEFTNSDYQAALEALEFYGMSYEEMDKQVIDMVDSIQKGIPYEIKTNFKTIVLF